MTPAGSQATKRVPWWRQEVEGSKLQILRSKAISTALSYLLLAFFYSVFALRWWTVILVAGGIVGAMIMARGSKRPLSILDSAPEKHRKE